MIEYNLNPFERAFIFQITKQDSKVKSLLERIGGTFYASNGWKIQISAEPEVNVFSKTIFLRGSNASLDLKVDRTWNLPSNSFRDSVISQVKRALSEIISSAKTFNNFVTSDGVVFDRFIISDKLLDFAEVLVNIASEVMPPKRKQFRVDSEGWGNNKLDPNKVVVLS